MSIDDVTAAAAAFAAGEVTYFDTEVVELPPPPDAEPMVPLGIRVPVLLAAEVRKVSEQRGVPYSRLIREWIEVGLTDLKSDQVVSLSALRRAIAHAAQTGDAA